MKLEFQKNLYYSKLSYVYASVIIQATSFQDEYLKAWSDGDWHAYLHDFRVRSDHDALLSEL